MSEFWEEAFRDKQELWGDTPARSAVLAKDLFASHRVKSVLIPGIGYGRNAQPFLDEGITVTGIEVSPTALSMAREKFGDAISLHLGSVTDMPFGTSSYDAIFCYGLIYLLDQSEREKLIADCFKQLNENGTMVFTAITKKASTFGSGTSLGEDRFEQFGGVKIYFYDRESIGKEFGSFGLVEVRDVEENYPFYFIICRKSRPLTSDIHTDLPDR